jgi:hypothetical protein
LTQSFSVTVQKIKQFKKNIVKFMAQKEGRQIIYFVPFIFLNVGPGKEKIRIRRDKHPVSEKLAADKQ